MNYFYKIGPSSINYDSTEETIILWDEHAHVKLAKAPFERIIKAWKDGTPTCWNARGCAPGWRLYDKGIIIEYYDKDVLIDIWLPEDDFEEIIQAYKKFTKQTKVELSYGRILPNGDFLWYNFISVLCPRLVMTALSVAISFVQLAIDDWAFERRNEMVFIYYKQKNVFELPVGEFTAVVNYWQKETQE